jgi:hypothetical protein
MKQVITTIVAWCDYPGCAEMAEAAGASQQDTESVEFWVYVSGKGRKTNPIKVEMCEEHRTELKTLFSSMQKFDQKPGAE